LACDILRRLGDATALAAALVECGAWTEALALAKQHPDISRNVYLPYARWLAEQEQFIEAQQGETFLISKKNEEVCLKNFCFFSLLRSGLFGGSGASSQHTSDELRGVKQIRRRLTFLLDLRQTSAPVGRQSVSYSISTKTF
jgi:hypothetical protein